MRDGVTELAMLVGGRKSIVSGEKTRGKKPTPSSPHSAENEKQNGPDSEFVESETASAEGNEANAPV